MAYSTTNATPPSAPGQKKAIIAVRSKVNATTASKNIFLNGTSGANIQFRTNTGNKMKYQFQSSGTVSVSGPETDTNWHTDIFYQDLTATETSEVFKWIRDGELQTLTSATIITTGEASFNPSTVFNLFSVFAGSNGSNVSDAEIEFFFAD